ncbi:MAG: ATP-dependent Clp protease adaptor ClpS [Chlorobia bacterium]|nr:ATP-dependent Clp protease adaptor ClpS [Fimbriimonadaceae bacterium]
MSNPGILDRPEELTHGPETGGGYIVTVYNNEHNTYDEVMMILMAATQCDAEEAYMETWEIDHLGKSVVHRAGEDECETVADVISTIGIEATVSEEWPS